MTLLSNALYAGGLGVLLCASGCAAGVPAHAVMEVSDAPPSGAAGVPGTAVGLPQYPSLSPNGSTVVFSWGGDLWAAPVSGGLCSRLTVHPADERRSAFSPDGTQLAFESDRDGTRNIYVMPLTRGLGGTAAGGSDGVLVGGTPRRVTASDRAQSLSGFASDGKAVLFSGYAEPSNYRAPRMYRAELAGPAEPVGAGGVTGGQVTRLTDAFGAMPRMSGDGKAVLFVRGYAPVDRPKYAGSGAQDVWRMTLPEGAFTQVTTNPTNDFDGWPLPDGSTLVVSSRDGENNVWRIGPGGESSGGAVQLTRFACAPGQATIGHGVRDLAVSADGKTAVFVVWDRLYRLDLTKPDAQPEAIELAAAADDAVLEIQRLNVDKEITEALLSPDGKTLAVIARGGVFVRATAEGYPTRRVTNSAGRERDLAWSPDGRVLYFASDDPGLDVTGAGTQDQWNLSNLGKYSIYQAAVELSREDIAPKKEEKAAEGEKKDEKKEDGGKPGSDGKSEDGGAKAGEEKKPEGKAAASGGKAKEKQPDFGKRWSEALRFRIEPVVQAERDARRPIPSPDGRSLIYTRGLGDVMLVNLESGAQRELLGGWDEAEVVWAGDSRHIVYAVSDLDFNSDIWLMDTGGADGATGSAGPINLTRHPDNDVSPVLSADGKVLTFLSQRGEQDDQFDVFQVFLDRELEGMTGYERDEYFKKAGEAGGKRKPAETPAFALKRDPAYKAPEAKAQEAAEPKADAGAEGAKKDDAARAEAKPKKADPMRFDADDAYLRIRRISSGGGNKGDLAVSPGADRIVFSTPMDDGPALVSVDHKGQDRKVIQSGPAQGVGISLTGDKVSLIKQGTVSTAPVKGGKADALPIDAPVVIDLARQQRQKFLECSRTFGDRFYHPTLKGLDWPALTRRYLTLAESTRTSAEFNRVAEMLFGEVDGSHTGASGGPGYSTASPAIGYLGVRVKPVAGGYEVVRVMPESPASQKTSRIDAGDVIIAVDGVRLAPDGAALPVIAMDAALAGKAGKEVLIELRRAPAGAGSPDGAPAKSAGPMIVIVPSASAANLNLAYRDEVLERRAKVEALSGGKIGYLHIRSMGDAEVRDYERDLYAAASGKDALIIDVRDNPGGRTADILLASLMAPRHAWTAPRGVDLKAVPSDAYPRDRRLIYGYSRPLDVLINQNSFSNAEIFAHAIKTTGRGRLVGVPTFGGVISTGGFTLIDGTMIRMPSRGWHLPDGTDMESNGARPEVLVPQTPEDEVAGRDAQLEAAVQDLLEQLGRRPQASVP